MLKGTERLGRLVDQLLELAQFESGGIRIDRLEFGVGEVVADAAAEVRPVSTEIPIVTDIEHGLFAMGDPERIHEVLTNLLTNAVRHSPAGGEVTVAAAARPGGGVRMEVRDQGTGVPAEAVERIFDRFYRVDTGPRPGSGGAGLGLAIARSIVELHGGSIRAEPRPPAGCRIVIDLPG